MSSYQVLDWWLRFQFFLHQERAINGFEWLHINLLFFSGLASVHFKEPKASNAFTSIKSVMEISYPERVAHRLSLMHLFENDSVSIDCNF